MKLEVGKYYRTRDGQKVGPMYLIPTITDLHRFTFTHNGGVSCWSEAGISWSDKVSRDLIAEWQDEPAQTTRATILDTAKQYVTHDRQATHGKPEDTFGLIAAYWSAHLDVTITATDVAAMMALLKLARIKMNPKHIDSYVDLCGYAACAGELAND